ncbi:SDR family NAD(P)-dependent oxidoreductase [Rhodococcus sp. NPDC059968]|uniref:SDR family NAD(P)-dependent oxidoreductase n=1 Tax=Rhodococcus sp. NPDC059968 TaxID=3347017 RepID=UPI0036725BC6
MIGLDGAVALVAGVGPGLGTSTATALARAGASLVVAARSQASVDSAVDAVSRVGASATGVIADLTRPEERESLLHVLEERGGLDVLVYNASSTGQNVDIADVELDDWRHLAEVNLWSPIALAQSALPLLRKSDRASVVMVSAMTTRMVSARGRGGYAITKAALNQAVKTMAFEFGADDIRVNGVVPGWMETPTIREWRDDPDKRPHLERAASQIPLGGIPHPNDVAGTVVFLASRLSAAVTGELVDSNGGQYMRG